MSLESRTILESSLKALAIYDAHNTYMTVEECAKFLKLHAKTITNRIYTKKIKAELIGRTWRIPKLQFMEIIIDEYQ